MDTATDDLELRRSSGLWDMIDAEYQKLGIKVIALGASTGYQFLLREPTNEGTLEGLQIRSNPAYDTIIEEFGGAPIQLPMPEVFTALQKGLIDGTAFPLHGLQGRKMWEVTDYIVRPSFGQGTAFVGMNLDKWNALSPGMQETMLEAGRMFEARAFEVVNALAQEDEAAMKANGVEITELSDDYAARIDEIFNRGIWRRAIANSGEAAETIVAFIEDNGLATHD
jgi:TRAP-type C4-dicarboxylate transport system substrate-binding protein